MNIASLEDDPVQAALIESCLTKAGYSCTVFHTGKSLLTTLAKPHDFNLLVLDWEVPDVSGLDVLHWIRDNQGYALPVLFLTSRTDESDLVVGLQAGADDYMTKPIREGELVARVQALLRRMNPITQSNEPFSFGVYDIDPINNIIKLHGKEVVLAPKEYELALLLFRNPGRLFSRDVLSTAVWNREIPATSRTLDTHLSNIRRKLQLRPENGVRLNASYALGYRLESLLDNETT
ncbi:response regulator transcription factor [Paenalcaligenes sp.]|uniref:response regulator transcription factor n=1 Tax=Paenalcaligenes sp. TaxID=1966342 RepID=UPI002630D3EB|nr:response regulator transcription factor [Paenalcaligenes sp.]